MAINKNHEFEELGGIKCAIVEKNVSQNRVDFLKQLLEFNKYTVVVTETPPLKVVPSKPTALNENDESSVQATGETALTPATFTVGVTDVRFNATNAIFGRMLKTKDRHIVTLAYWQQKETIPNDEVPYFNKS